MIRLLLVVITVSSLITSCTVTKKMLVENTPCPSETVYTLDPYTGFPLRFNKGDFDNPDNFWTQEEYNALFVKPVDEDKI